MKELHETDYKGRKLNIHTNESSNAIEVKCEHKLDLERLDKYMAEAKKWKDKRKLKRGLVYIYKDYKSAKKALMNCDPKWEGYNVNFRIMKFELDSDKDKDKDKDKKNNSGHDK